MAACDPSVAALNLFHLLDEDDRDRFQSGLIRADGSPKDSIPLVTGRDRVRAPRMAAPGSR